MLRRLFLALALISVFTLTATADTDPVCIPVCDLNMGLISVPNTSFFGLQPVTYSISDGDDIDLITLQLDLNMPGIDDPNRTAIRNGYTYANAAWYDAEQNRPGSPWHEVVINGQDWLVDPPMDMPTETPEAPTVILLGTGLLGIGLAYRSVNHRVTSSKL